MDNLRSEADVLRGKIDQLEMEKVRTFMYLVVMHDKNTQIQRIIILLPNLLLK